MAAALTIVVCGSASSAAPPGRTVLVQKGTFDTCVAPTVKQMATWKRFSPYNGIGIYLGGANYGCPGGQPSAQWIKDVRKQGWRFLPLYVGLQAPCYNGSGAKIYPPIASTQGLKAADDAIKKANLLGIGQLNPIFLDMEAYGRDPNCIVAVRKFVNAWVYRLHVRKYYAGLYSSSASGMADQNAVYLNKSFHKPDVIWFANWDRRRSVWNDPWINNKYWTAHQRHHQYLGGHLETWGKVQLNIDRSLSDGTVAR